MEIGWKALIFELLEMRQCCQPANTVDDIGCRQRTQCDGQTEPGGLSPKISTSSRGRIACGLEAIVSSSFPKRTSPSPGGGKTAIMDGYAQSTQGGPRQTPRAWGTSAPFTMVPLGLQRVTRLALVSDIVTQGNETPRGG